MTETDNLKKQSTLKCCESGCEDCPFDFPNNLDIKDFDPEIPRELQLENDKHFENHSCL